jgi:hypothetical protein
MRSIGSTEKYLKYNATDNLNNKCKKGRIMHALKAL